MTKRKTKRKSALERLSRIIFAFSLLFYCGSKVVVNAYNITLSKEEQSIAAKNNQKQDAVEELQVTIRNMQDKKEVLGMLKNEVQDNQNNIFIIGNSDE